MSKDSSKRREEIFLAMLQGEYELWIKELEKIISDNKKLTKKICRFVGKFA